MNLNIRGMVMTKSFLNAAMVVLSMICVLSTEQALAGTVRNIRIQTTSYSSPATLIFNNVQAEIVLKAIQACGRKKLVESISKIDVAFSSSQISRTLGTISDDQIPSLDLNYPAIVASATVICK